MDTDKGSKEFNELTKASMKAIQELAQIYNSGLSISAIKFRLHRIADDLNSAADNSDKSKEE